MSQPLVFDIIARDRASDTTKRIGSGFSKLGFATAGIFAGMGAAVGRFAVNQLGNAARAVGAFVADSVRQFSDFDRSMREVWTLLPDLSASAFKDLQGDVRGFVTEMGIAHQEAVPALYQAISAGVPQENVFDFLTTAAKFSIGGVTSLETAVDGLTSVTNAYGREVLSAQEASDIFFTTVRLGKTTAAELSANLFQVIPTAASLGIQFGTVGAALAAITAQGVPTSVATTQLRQMFIELNKEGGKTASLFDDLAGKSFADFIQGGGTVQGALALLTEHAADSNTSLSNLFGSVEAGNAALALTSKSGAALFNGALGEMTDTTGATDAAFSKMDEGMGRTWDRLMIRIDDLKVGLGERLAPAIEGVLDWLEQIGENSDAAGETFKALGDAAESELGGRVVPELEEFAETFQGTMTQNEGALKELTRVVGIALAGQVFNWGVYTKELVFFKDMAVTVLRFTANAVIKWADTFLAAGEAAFGWVPGIGDQFRRARDRMREFRQGINRELDNIRSRKTINIVTQFSTSGSPPPGYAGGSTRIFMQHGGKVAGPFTGVDRVPAMLTTGEFVVNREATARHEPLLRAINSGSPSVTLNQSFSSSGNRADDFIIEVVRRGLRGNAGFRSDLRSAARA
jgi:TP901 family phage tail tape measure protein